MREFCRAREKKKATNPHNKNKTKMIAMESPPQKCMCKNCKCEKCECKVLRRCVFVIRRRVATLCKLRRWGGVGRRCFSIFFERDTKYSRILSSFFYARNNTYSHISLSLFKKMRRILMPIDSTGEDVEVLNWVLDNVSRSGDEIVLLHV